MRKDFAFRNGALSAALGFTTALFLVSVAQADPPTGPAGGALTGSYPNPGIAAGAVTRGKIKNGSVTAGKLGDIIRRSATSAAIPANGNGSVTASCLEGEVVIGGGNDGFFDVYVVASRDNGSTGWTVFAKNVSAANRTVTAHVYCLEK